MHTCRCKAEAEEWSDLIRLASSAACDSVTNANIPSCLWTRWVQKFLLLSWLQWLIYSVCLLKIHSEPATLLLPMATNVSVSSWSMNRWLLKKWQPTASRTKHQLVITLWFNSYTCSGRENRWFSEVTANACCTIACIYARVGRMYIHISACETVDKSGILNHKIWWS